MSPKNHYTSGSLGCNPNDSLGKKRPAIFQSLMLGTSHKHDILPGT